MKITEQRRKEILQDAKDEDYEATQYHPTILDIVGNLKDAEGRYQFVNYLTNGISSSLLGYRYGQSDELPDSSESTANKSFVCFGNPRNLIYGDRIALEIKYYDQTQQSVEYFENFFRCRFRGSFNVSLPGSWVKLTTGA